MSIRGPGRGGRPGGTSAPPKSSESKASGTFGAKSAGAASGASTAAGARSAAMQAATAQVLELVRQLKSGELKSRDEATKKFIGDILKRKPRTSSKKLKEKVFEALADDPRLAKTLERMWDRAEDQV